MFNQEHELNEMCAMYMDGDVQVTMRFQILKENLWVKY